MGSSHGEDPRFGGVGQRAAESPVGSGRQSPLSVCELPASHNSPGPAMDTAVVDDRKRTMGVAAQGAEGPSIAAPSPMSEWPRGRPRNAISRVGYLSDADDIATSPTVDDRVSGPHGSNSGLKAITPPPTEASTHMSSPTGAKGLRGMPRHRIQHTHLAVPTAMGHIRPRAKPTESPREPPTPPPVVRPRPAALSRMASRQEPFGGPSDATLRSSALSRQESAGHVPADSVSQASSPEAKSQRTSVLNGSPASDSLRRKMSSAAQNGLSIKMRPVKSPEREAEGDDGGGPANLSASKTSPTEGEEKSDLQPRTVGEGEKGRDADESRPLPLPRAIDMQRGVAGVFASENERRAAALASRRSSRAISRAEGSGDFTRLAERADVARAAAEQLRKMGAPTPEAVSGARSAATAENGSGRAGKPFQGPMEAQQGKAPEGSPTYRPRLRGDESAGMPSSKTMADGVGKLPVPTTPTAPPKDGLSPSPGASDSPQRHRVPQSLPEAQQELKLMLEIEQQRRAAATASRARSRIISRAEGSFDAQKFAERSNVANAAAEQLRKLVEATGREDHPPASLDKDRRRNAAAAKIQAVWRGHRMRVWATAARVIARFTKFAIICTKRSPLGATSTQRVKVTI